MSRYLVSYAILKFDKVILRYDSEIKSEGVVGDAGFEPATPWTQTKCATKLR